jgi:hypothetical protein
VQNWSLRSAEALVIRELAAAEQSEMQALRHLRNVGEEWINIKTELGERGTNIDDWCKKNMPITRQWLDRHAELHKIGGSSSQPGSGPPKSNTHPAGNPVWNSPLS